MDIYSIISETCKERVSKDGGVIVSQLFLSAYKRYVESFYKDKIDSWPLISIHNLVTMIYNNFGIAVYKHTGSGQCNGGTVFEKNSAVKNGDDIEEIRQVIKDEYDLKGKDAVVIMKNDAQFTLENGRRVINLHKLFVQLERELNINFM